MYDEIQNFLNKYFIRPIKSLVDYTKSIKNKDLKTNGITNFLKRKDEVGHLSRSLNDMTQDLYNRINIAENFSTDLTMETTSISFIFSLDRAASSFNI